MSQITDNTCASCFKKYDDDPFRNGTHNLCHGYSCGHSSCGYDESGKYVNQCLLPDCISRREQESEKQSQQPQQPQSNESSISKEDKTKLQMKLQSLVKEFATLKDNPPSDNFDKIVREFRQLLYDTIRVHNKDKGDFALMWVKEGVDDILTGTARSARNECSYEYPETRPSKIQYVNTKLIEKMTQLFKDNGYE